MRKQDAEEIAVFVLKRSNVNAGARRCGCRGCGCRARACRRGCACIRRLLPDCGATGCFALAVGGSLKAMSLVAAHGLTSRRELVRNWAVKNCKDCNTGGGGAVGAVVILHAAGQDVNLQQRRAEGAAGDAPKAGSPRKSEIHVTILVLRRAVFFCVLRIVW